MKKSRSNSRHLTGPQLVAFQLLLLAEITRSLSIGVSERFKRVGKSPGFDPPCMCPGIHSVHTTARERRRASDFRSSTSRKEKEDRAWFEIVALSLARAAPEASFLPAFSHERRREKDAS